MRMISWIRDGGLLSRTLRGTERTMRREEASSGFPPSGPLQIASLPFDSAEKSRASLVVEGDDDAGGGKVAVVAHGRAPTQRRAENRSHEEIGVASASQGERTQSCD